MDRVGRETWAKRVERWQESGRSAAEFARETGINARSLSWWAWRLGKHEKDRTPAPRRQRQRKTTLRSVPLTFVEMTPTIRGEALEVVLASGRCIRIPIGFDVETLERLLGVLERST
jgi:hypothetical protein